MFTLCMLQEVRPDLTEEGHEFLFQLADKAGDGSIDVLDFLNVRLRLHSQLVRISSALTDWRHHQDKADREPGRGRR